MKAEEKVSTSDSSSPIISTVSVPKQSTNSSVNSQKPKLTNVFEEDSSSSAKKMDKSKKKSQMDELKEELKM